MILAIDFDRTIHNNNDIPHGHRMGRPMPGARDALVVFKQDGHTIIIHTCRAVDDRSIKIVSDWMAYFDIPYDSITNIKPVADVYLDDKGVRFVSWQLLSSRPEEWT